MIARKRLNLYLVCSAVAVLSLAACARRDGRPTATIAAPRATAVIQAAAPQASPTAPLPTATKAPPPTPRPLPTATSVPTALPTETAVALPSPTPPPTAIPTPTATATVPAPPLPDWLTYLNRFRTMAALPAVTDWEEYTRGSRLHSQYMAVNDAAIAHAQDKSNPLYSDEGNRAAQNGNIFATSQLDADYVWSINFWASGPFHMIGMLDPKLGLVGYGDAVEDAGDVKMAAVLDVGSDPGTGIDSISFPILYPGADSETWVVRHGLFEWPDPLTSCPGFTRPSGAAIVVMLGTGQTTPQVASHRLARGDTVVDTCLFDETNYSNPDAYAQKVGRQILDLNDAIVIMPREPLIADETYTAQLTANGQTFTWQFRTRKGPG